MYTDKVLLPSQEVIEKYHFLDYPFESVVTLITNKKNEICFVKSLWYTTQKIQLELPGGGVNKDEDILVAAKREFLEETGLIAESLQLQYSFNPSNGMSNEIIHIVFGSVSNTIQKNFDTDEVSEVSWKNIEEVKNLLKHKTITDGISLLPLLLYINKKEHI